MFDFHLHLARFSEPEQVAKFLFEQKISFNAVACEPWEWEKLKKIDWSLQKEGKKFYGIHPMVASQTTNDTLKQLNDLLERDPNAHVGEGGLDKRYEGYELGGLQELVFKQQVITAKELRRDLQIHCVGDYGRIVKILKDCDYPASPECHPIFHRFGGDVSIVKSSQKLNPLFSLHLDSFRKKSTLMAIVQIPLEQIRFETDLDRDLICSINNNTTAASDNLSKASKLVFEISHKLKSTISKYKELQTSQL